VLSRELPFLKFVLHLIVKYSFKKTKERENKKEKGKRKKKGDEMRKDKNEDI